MKYLVITFLFVLSSGFLSASETDYSIYLGFGNQFNNSFLSSNPVFKKLTAGSTIPSSVPMFVSGLNATKTFGFFGVSLGLDITSTEGQVYDYDSIKITQINNAYLAGFSLDCHPADRMVLNILFRVGTESSFFTIHNNKDRSYPNSFSNFKEKDYQLSIPNEIFSTGLGFEYDLFKFGNETTDKTINKKGISYVITTGLRFLYHIKFYRDNWTFLDLPISNADKTTNNTFQFKALIGLKIIMSGS